MIHEHNLHVSICDTHPCDGTECRHQIDEPCKYCANISQRCSPRTTKTVPLAPEAATLRKTKPQKAVHMINAGYGTPMRLTLLKMLGAFPSRARPYRVRDPIYKSELAALRTKTRIAPLITWFRTLMPTYKVDV